MRTVAVQGPDGGVVLGLYLREREKVARVATHVVWVGIDAGKDSHHAAAVDADGRRQDSRPAHW